jgi:hypothetical protein
MRIHIYRIYELVLMLYSNSTRGYVVHRNCGLAHSLVAGLHTTSCDCFFLNDCSGFNYGYTSLKFHRYRFVLLKRTWPCFIMDFQGLSRRPFLTRKRSLNLHCKEIWIYVFPAKEVRGLSPNFHVSVSELYIPTFGPPIFLQQNRQTDRGIYKLLTET